MNFDDSCAKRQIPGCARFIAAEAADLACREDPLDFKADKRGRTRQVFDSIREEALELMLEVHLVVSRPTSGCVPLFWRASIGPTALIVNLEPRAVTSDTETDSLVTVVVRTTKSG